MIKNFKKECIRPANVNLRLGKIFKIKENKIIDWENRKRPEITQIKLPHTINHGEYLIGETIESFDIPPNVTCIILPVSKGFRSGLIINGVGTADPGYKGTLHMGIYNASRCKIVLREGMEVIKVVISTVEGTTIPLQSEWIGGKVI